jgi:hypothetical protein
MDQLDFFPPFLPDEDFRSIQFEYLKLRRPISVKALKNELFGVVSYSIISVFPKNLGYLVSKLARFNVNVFDLIHNHTIITFLALFIARIEIKQTLRA